MKNTNKTSHESTANICGSRYSLLAFVELAPQEIALLKDPLPVMFKP
jgi:hypothetical protein